MNSKIDSKFLINQILSGRVLPINSVVPAHHVFFIQNQFLVNLSKLKPFLALLHIVKEYLFIIGTAYICNYYFCLYSYILVVIWIGARQHALGVIGHDAVHFRLIKNKKINDFVGDLLCLNPLFITIEGYRREHLLHHKYVGTEIDLDWLRSCNYAQYKFPQPNLTFKLNLLKHLLGFYALRDFYDLLIKCKFVLNVSFYSYVKLFIFNFLLITFLYKYNLFYEYFLYWVIPSLTMLVACLYFRLIAEHFYVSKSAMFNTRNIIPKWWEKLIISPNNVNLHLDHHLYPSVPFYNLYKLHNKLIESELYNKQSTNLMGYTEELISEITFKSNKKKFAINS